MKKLLLLLLLPILGYSQSRVNDGVYTSPVASNWPDSVKKYHELQNFYLYNPDLDREKLRLWDKFYKLYVNYTAKIDSVKNITVIAEREKQRIKLEDKYKIKLP